MALKTAEACFSTSCSRKDELTARNITTKACYNGPVRDKSKLYRTVNVAFYTISLTAIVAQFAVRFSVGRLQWLDDGNMVMVLAMNTLLFGVCYKMSFIGLGLDMWNVPFPNITTTLLVRFNLPRLLYQANNISSTSGLARSHTSTP